jgi:hypothetical protein
MTDVDAALAAATNEPEPKQEAPSPLKDLLAKPSQIKMGTKGFEAETLDDCQRLAKVYLAGGAVPKNTLTGCVDKTEQLARVVCIIEAGKNVGLGARESLTGIAYIQGRLCLWGDATIAIVQARRDCLGIETSWHGEGDSRVCKVIARRANRPDVTYTFGVTDSRKAGLWGKAGPWSQYPDRMLQQRARAFALRDQFADALMGFAVAEEVNDYTDGDAADGVNDALAKL